MWPKCVRGPTTSPPGWSSPTSDPRSGPPLALIRGVGPRPWRHTRPLAAERWSTTSQLRRARTVTLRRSSRRDERIAVAARAPWPRSRVFRRVVRRALVFNGKHLVEARVGLHRLCLARRQAVALIANNAYQPKREVPRDRRPAPAPACVLGDHANQPGRWPSGGPAVVPVSFDVRLSPALDGFATPDAPGADRLGGRFPATTRLLRPYTSRQPPASQRRTASATPTCSPQPEAGRLAVAFRNPVSPGSPLALDALLKPNNCTASRRGSNGKTLPSVAGARPPVLVALFDSLFELGDHRRPRGCRVRRCFSSVVPDDVGPRLGLRIASRRAPVPGPAAPASSRRPHGRRLALREKIGAPSTGGHPRALWDVGDGEMLRLQPCDGRAAERPSVVNPRWPQVRGAPSASGPAGPRGRSMSSGPETSSPLPQTAPRPRHRVRRSDGVLVPTGDLGDCRTVTGGAGLPGRIVGRSKELIIQRRGSKRPLPPRSRRRGCAALPRRVQSTVAGRRGVADAEWGGASHCRSSSPTSVSDDKTLRRGRDPGWSGLKSDHAGGERNRGDPRPQTPMGSVQRENVFGPPRRGPPWSSGRHRGGEPVPMAAGLLRNWPAPREEPDGTRRNSTRRSSRCGPQTSAGNPLRSSRSMEIRGPFDW